MRPEEEIRDLLEKLKKDGILFKTDTGIIYKKGYGAYIETLEYVLNENQEEQ